MTATTWGRFSVDVAEDAVVLRDGSGELLRCTLRPWVAGEPLAVQEVSTAPDEVELSGTGPGLRWRVRHAFSDAWHTRVLLSADQDCVVGPLRWELATEHPTWCWGAGVHGLLAVLVPGPEVLLTRTVRATLHPGADLGPVTLAGGSQTVLSLRTRWETRGEVAGSLPAWLPRLERGLGDPLELVHADAALVVPESVTVSSSGPVSELWAAEAGSWPVSLHGPEGETVLQPCWSPELADVLSTRAARLLADAPRRQGVVVLDDPAALLVLARGGVGAERDEAVARGLAVEDQAVVSPWSVLLAVEEHQRSGAPELLDRAEQLLASLAPVPGTPTAAMAVLVARATSGGDPSSAAAVLARMSAAPQPGDGQALLRLELDVLAGRLTGTSVATVTTVVDRLGAGLPGEALDADPLRVSRDATLLRWLPDEATRTLLPRLFGASSVADLVQRTECRLLAAPVPDEALAWLTTTVLDR